VAVKGTHIPAAGQTPRASARAGVFNAEERVARGFRRVTRHA